MRNKVIAGAVILALLAGGGWWWAKRRSTAASAEQKQVQYTKVRRGDIVTSISGSGPVTASNGVTFKADQTGTVAQVLAQDGDQVKAGQVLLVLENPNLVLSLKQAELDVAQAQESLDSLVSPEQAGDTAIQTQQLKVESARLTLQQRQADSAALTVIAPVGGVVSAVSVREGSDVGSNALLVSIFDDSAPVLIVNLSQEAAAAVKMGQKATVNLPGIGQLTGTVIQSAGSAIPASGNRDANVPVAIELPPTTGIRAGLVGQVTIAADGLTYLIQANGTIRNDVVEVRAKVTGKTAQMAVQEGDRVKAGDLLVQLSSETLGLQLRQAEHDVTLQQEALNNLLDPELASSTAVAQARQKLEQAQLTLSVRQADVAKLMVKAPVDGQVSGLTVKAGDQVSNNQQLFRVADYGAMQVSIAVDELDIAKVKVGQPAQITLDALPDKSYAGKVAKINPEGTFKNDIATFDVTVQIEKSEGLMAGMNATADVVVESRQGVLFLPAQAVHTQAGRSFVQVMENGQAARREVQVGLTTSAQAEITGGLAEGQEVILSLGTQTSATPSQQGGPFGGSPFGGGNRVPGAGGGMNRPTGGTAPQSGGR